MVDVYWKSDKQEKNRIEGRTTRAGAYMCTYMGRGQLISLGSVLGFARAPKQPSSVELENLGQQKRFKTASEGGAYNVILSRG